ncbi:hypothetical protein [Methylocystis sp. B8]|uniref:hypothetical protein n=1 Tax=Methylocystis sp. B8 TaxID=544938 RepID=UPI0010FEB5D0|nr:hypothetical protein [Methylocystis sp. B8]TLG73705.1 hypothetical protein FEV16_13120 [Methylocystis sp. B8]
MHDIAEQIRGKILEWQKRNAASVSEQAKQIVLAAVSAISYDPHPDWRLPDDMMPWPSMDQGLLEIQQDAINKLPKILDELAERSPNGKNIDAFTVLHAASTILDRICPFDKAARNR